MKGPIIIINQKVIVGATTKNASVKELKSGEGYFAFPLFFNIRMSNGKCDTEYNPTKVTKKL